MAAPHPSTSPATAGDGRSQLRRRLLGPGWALLVVGAIIASAAVHTGNNRLYLVLGGMVAMVAIELLLGAWNLRNISVVRRLPPELFAGRRGRGEVQLSNVRRVLPAASLLLREQGHSARGQATWLGPGERLSVPLTWRFMARGQARLEALELCSRFPFGLLEHVRVLERPVTVLVYPAPTGVPVRDSRRTVGSHLRDDDLHDPRGSGAGDFLGLREYQPGDPTRLIHWRSSARAGRPLIVIRGSDSDEQVLVELDHDGDRTRWERNISQACGQVLHHVRLGRAVGMRVGRRSWPPRRGAPQHRALLTALALLPHSDDPEPQP
jgi:uncharacterized protein (DUF58 family)